MIDLIIQYFRVKRMNNNCILFKRQNEYTYCLKKNLEYKYINKIHILIENDDDIQELKNENIDINNNKLILFKINKRMHYNDALSYANKYLLNKIVCILHSDIFLTDGFAKININNLDNKLYALSRTNNYNGKNTGRGIRIHNINNKKYCGTFDGWIVKTPIQKDIIDNLDQQQNVWGSENRLIYIFKKYNYNVITPNILKMVHWHNTDIRPNQNDNWIQIDGTLISNNEQQKWRINNRKLNNNFVGGRIPIIEGVSEMVEYL